MKRVKAKVSGLIEDEDFQDRVIAGLNLEKIKDRKSFIHELEIYFNTSRGINTFKNIKAKEINLLIKRPEIQAILKEKEKKKITPKFLKQEIKDIQRKRIRQIKRRVERRIKKRKAKKQKLDFTEIEIRVLKANLKLKSMQLFLLFNQTFRRRARSYVSIRDKKLRLLKKKK